MRNARIDPEFIDSSPERLPELGIVAGTLRRAIQDAVYQPTKSERRGVMRSATSASTEVRAEAVAWLNSEDTAPWSALWCCDLLGLDIETIRHEVRERPRAVRDRMHNARLTK